jgi:hypothetical protein
MKRTSLVMRATLDDKAELLVNLTLWACGLFAIGYYLISLVR